MSEEIKYEVYSPASVIGIFNNALKLPVTVNLIYLKGRYSYGMGKAYSNYYYDHLYSESDNTSIGVKISGLLRSKIINNDIYTLKGFIEKRIKNNLIIRFLESLFSRLIITKKLLNLDKKIYEFMLCYTGK